MEVVTTATLNKFIKLLAYQEEGLVAIIKQIVDIFIGINYKWFYLNSICGVFMMYQDLNIQQILEERYITNLKIFNQKRLLIQ